MNRSKSAFAALIMGAAAMVALGQNADKNSAGPTKNDYRLKVLEPAEGAVITGSTVRVVVNTENRELGEDRKDVNSMPRPDVDVFLDSENKGTMRDVNNVLTIDGVPQGDHKIILLAKNRANEIIDRKEIHFSSTADTTAASTLGQARTDSTLEPVRETAPMSPNPYPSNPAPVDTTAMAPARPVTSYAQSTSPSTPAPAPPVDTTYQQATNNRARTLPETATTDPLLLTAGAVLLLGGLSLRRLR
ncbi:MAG TPA: hypothetical protein VGG65_05235 [Thermoanaerobaculia bacterium]